MHNAHVHYTVGTCPLSNLPRLNSPESMSSKQQRQWSCSTQRARALHHSLALNMYATHRTLYVNINCKKRNNNDDASSVLFIHCLGIVSFRIIFHFNCDCVRVIPPSHSTSKWVFTISLCTQVVVYRVSQERDTNTIGLSEWMNNYMTMCPCARVWSNAIQFMWGHTTAVAAASPSQELRKT